MKYIDSTNISGNQGAPFLKNTHDHYKEAISETSSAIVKGLLGTYTTNDIIILHGCSITANIPGTSAITAGAVYYNGEVFEVDANASISVSGGQTLVWSIASTYRSGDPVYWSDGVQRDQHLVRKFQLTGAASGSGLADYNATTVKRLYGEWTNLTLINGWATSGGNTPQYKIDQDGWVHLRGALNPAAATNINFAAIPTGAMPTRTSQFFNPINVLSSGLTGTVAVAVAPSGISFYNVQSITPGTTTGVVYLFGVSYNLD